MIHFVLTIVMLVFIAIWFESLRVAINSLSGGYIRSLDDDKTAKAVYWKKDQHAYTFTLRALSYIVTIIYTCYCYQNIFVDPLYVFENNTIQTIKQIVFFGLLLILYQICRETFGAVWLSYYRYPLLRYSLPIINVFRIILKAYEYFMMNSFRKAKLREDHVSEDQEVSMEDEILSMVENDIDTNLEEDEKRMIKGVFDLNDKFVRESMTPRIDTIGINATAEEARTKFMETNFSRLPVYKDHIDNIKGILYCKDFFDVSRINGKSLFELTHRPLCVPEDTPLDKLLDLFLQSHHHMAIVQDQYGGTSGIITMEDVLEEIVGDIQDEYDEPEEEYEITKYEDGSLVVDAKVTISDINDLMDSDNLPDDDDDFDTIGGYIYSEISRIPMKGEIVELDHYVARIIDADERRILRIELSPKKPQKVEN
jgi:putative hemolysin